MTAEDALKNYIDALNAPSSPEKKERVLAALAEMKKHKVNGRLPDALVIKGRAMLK